jgi:hypothetical protein
VTMTIPPPDPALEVGYLPGTDLSAPKATDSLAFWGQLHSLTAAAAGFAMLPIPAGLPEYALYRLGTTGALPFRVAQTPAVRLSRFFATSTRYAPVKSTVFGRLASSLFPALKLQQHHIAVQQYWFRGVADLQKFMPYQGAVTLGLQRLGNAGWNLMPIPAALNNLLGRSTLGTAAFAGVAYGSVPVIGYGAYQGTQYAQYLLFSNWSSDDDDQ